MSKTIRVLIVEDEFTIALDLELTLKKWGHEVIGIAQNYESAVLQIADSDPQLIILDIHLKGKKSGIDLARLITKDYQIPFIYLTAYGDRKTFAEASKTYPFAFLTKPYQEVELNRAIELAINQFERINNSIPDMMDLINQLQLTQKKSTSIFFAKEGNRIRKINIDLILYISALDNYVEVHFEDDRIILHESLSRLEKKLKPYNITRVHRSFLVALNAIEKIEEDRIIIGNKEIPVSRSYKKEVIDQLTWL